MSFSRMEEVERLLRRYPVDGTQIYDYGTAGFRYEASLLPCVAVRIGLLSAVHSKALGGDAVGVMITASHNGAPDNGLKLADATGGMWNATWESKAVVVANLKQPSRVLRYLSDLSSSSSSLSSSSSSSVVHVGRDTRDHSPALAQLVVRAARAMGATVVDHGLLTTPQLHHVVMHANAHLLPPLICPRRNESGYFETLCHSYQALLHTTPLNYLVPLTERTVWVDCACGVGYDKVVRLNRMLQCLKLPVGSNSPLVNLVAVNGPADGPLNEHCGAEHVQKQRLPPRIYSDITTENSTNTPYFASLDGDADRIVFHYHDPKDGTFCLLDGDKIAALLSAFCQEELNVLYADSHNSNNTPILKCGVVQTAYANGASTKYLKDVVNTSVLIAKTGVKYVHAAAHDNFNVGVYFEANGHGTILFSSSYHEVIGQMKPTTERAQLAVRRLRLLPSLVNQSVGDALSNLLLVDAILFLQQWDMTRWQTMYRDLPSRQQKVKVPDRSMIKTNDNETKVLAPASLQKALDAACHGSAEARCFVRPSGTENAVRIYAEAATQRQADDLASEAVIVVQRICGGTNPSPTIVSKL